MKLTLFVSSVFSPRYQHGNPENKICRLGFSGPGVECDWVIHKNAENSKSVVMLIHGGAYAIGSTRIYRPMAQIISRRSGAKVFSKWWTNGGFIRENRTYKFYSGELQVGTTESLPMCFNRYIICLSSSAITWDRI